MPHGGPARALPIIAVLRGRNSKLLVRDLAAGVTVAALLVPQSMAYAELAGLPAVTGLYASLVPLLGYALLGSSRQLAVGPTATVAVLTATVIAPLASGRPSKALALAAMLALLVGGICVIAGLLRAGFVVNFLSAPVLSGYVTGAALVIGASQMGKAAGIQGLGRHLFSAGCQRVAQSRQGPGCDGRGRRGVDRADGAAPAVRTAVAGCAHRRGACHLGFLPLRPGRKGVAVTGTVPAGLPSPTFPAVGIHDVGALLVSAFGIALVCYVESIAVAKAIANRRGYRVDANREFVAIGMANLGAGLFRGFPVDGSFSRSASADDAGARTQLAGIVAAVVVGLTLLFLTPLFKDLPAATLGAVVIVAVSGLLDISGLRRAWEIRREDFLMGMIALVGVLTFGVLEGLLIAVGVSLVALVYHATLPHRAVLGYVPDDDSFRDMERTADSVTIPGVIVYRFDAPLFFANCRRLRDDLLELVAAAPTRVRAVVIDAEAITSLDTTGSSVLLELTERFDDLGIELIVARTRGNVRDVMRASGVTKALGPTGLAPTIRAAIDAVTPPDDPSSPLAPSRFCVTPTWDRMTAWRGVRRGERRGSFRCRW